MTVATSDSDRILRKRFGQWLKEQREKTGRTQSDVAELLDYKLFTMVSQVETGRTAMPSNDIPRWAEALRLKPNALAKKYLYFIQPHIYAVLYGTNPYDAEHLPRPPRTIASRR
jgi:transcriptional regulator with XRE-family HTH domain